MGQERKGKHRRQQNGLMNFVVAGIGILITLLCLSKRVFLTNIIGDRGNGFFSAAYELYMLFFWIASFSISKVVSRQIQLRVKKGQYKNAKRVFRMGLLVATIAGLLGGVLLFFLSNFLTEEIMAEPMGALALKMLAPALFFVSLSTVLRGYFEGIGLKMPVSISSTIEQLAMLIFGVIAANAFLQYGAKVAALLQNTDYQFAYAAIGGAVGICAGALLSLLFLFCLFILYNGVYKKMMEKDETRSEEAYKQLIHMLLIGMLPIAAEMILLHCSILLDQCLFNRTMIANAMQADKASLWGVFIGKIRPIILIFAALTGIISKPFLPAIRHAFSFDEAYKVNRRIGDLLHSAMVVMIPISVLLAVLAEPVIILLFGNKNTDIAVKLLQMGSVTLVFLVYVSLTNEIFHVIQKDKKIIQNGSLALVAHIVLLLILFNRFDMEIDGVIFSYMFLYFVQAVLNALSLHRLIRYRQELMRSVLLPVLTASIVGFFVYILAKGMHSLLNPLTIFIVFSLIGLLLYFGALMALKVVNERELSRIPCGNVMVMLGRMFHLL